MTIKIPQFIVLISTLCCVSCSTIQQADTAEKSGFLRNYSQLKKGGDDQPLYRYVNPEVRWIKYKKVIIEPVRIFAGKKSSLAEASQEDRQALANYFTAALREELSKDFLIVNQRDSDVMTIRTALTDGDSSSVALNTFTTIMPIGLAISALKRAFTGSDSFVGEAQCELEVLDSDTGERLAAAIDKQYGTKALRTKFGGWNDAKEAADFWAEQLRERLQEAKKGAF